MRRQPSMTLADRRDKTGLTMADKTLDVSNLNCPLPVLKAKKAINEVPVGGTLEVLATDQGSVGDFQSFCTATGNVLLEQSEADGTFRFLIRRAR